MRRMDTSPYIDSSLPNIYYTSPKDYEVDVNPLWIFHPTEPEPPMPTKSPAYYPAGLYGFPYFQFSTSKISRVIPIITEPSNTILDPTAVNHASEKDSSVKLFTWDIPTSDAPSTNSCTTSPSWAAHQPEGIPYSDAQTTRVECGLCNKSFSNQNYADTCFFEHLEMGSFHCYGACGDALW
jgi:hypothetical protein